MGNLKIGTRLTLVLGCVLLALVAVTTTGWWGLRTMGQASQNLLAQDVALAQVAAEIQNTVLMARRFEKDALINLTDEAKREDYTQRWRKVGSHMAETLARAHQLDLGREDAEAVAGMGQHFASYTAGIEQTLARVRAGELKSTQDANTAVGKYKAAVHGMEATSNGINERALRRANSAGSAIAAVQSRATVLQLTLSGVAVLLAIALCLMVTRSITGPLQHALAVAEAVATGDLRSRFDSSTRTPTRSTARDETGQLLDALQRMTSSLTRLVGQVRDVSDSIATGSAQIATGNADLSQRTEEQASNLQQTAASMEQLTATVRQNADTARAATQLVARASEVAGEGGQVVHQVVTTMAEINASSQKIADIIGVIDGIAFQTNILALNAAVEAARAGEQGRGFAVVASEVRSLAQRSATAAKEIKGLIGASVERVETGSRLVDQAGKTMDAIVDNVKRVSDLIGEISSASVEQSTGISQVSDAVNQLDQVTQQNAALVEESAAATESLKHQATKLSETVAVFKT